ncbi:hypothetical protein MRB53_027010 [Persea americana]|uniref:Uncharacterized protein n=1 Tax=Persea americana TaxID=3435 RepID=A0ACC2LKV4_PERAE|nr:hypothetical protein MRB53_027010 [Persea americana]
MFKWHFVNKSSKYLSCIVDNHGEASINLGENAVHEWYGETLNALIGSHFLAVGEVLEENQAIILKNISQVQYRYA